MIWKCASCWTLHVDDVPPLGRPPYRCALCIVLGAEKPVRKPVSENKSAAQMFEEIEVRKGLNNRAIAAKLAKIEELREDVKLLRLENDSFPVAKTRRAKRGPTVTVEGMTAVLTALDASLRADEGNGAVVTLPELRLTPVIRDDI